MGTTVLFGFKVYYVRGKRGKNYSMAERTNHIFSRFLSDDQAFADVSAILLDKHIGKDLKKERLLRLLSTACTRITYDIKATSEGGNLEVIPFLKSKEVDFSDLDRDILNCLVSKGGAFGSIKDLALHMNRRELSSVAYRVTKLANWGLIFTSGTREKRLKLTPIGRGVANGFIDADNLAVTV